MPVPIIGCNGHLSPKYPTTNRRGMDIRNINENISPAIS